MASNGVTGSGPSTAAGFWAGGDERYITYQMRENDSPGCSHARWAQRQPSAPGIQRSQARLPHLTFDLRRAYVQNSLIHSRALIQFSYIHLIFVMGKVLNE